MKVSLKVIFIKIKKQKVWINMKEIKKIKKKHIKKMKVMKMRVGKFIK